MKAKVRCGRLNENVSDTIEYFAVYIHSWRVSGSTRAVGCCGVSCYCSATHPSRTTKPKIRILGIVVREGCVALHYSVHFFHEFSLSRNERNRGGGYRCKICTVPSPFVCLPDPLEKMRDLNSGPCVWIPLVLPPNNIRLYLVEWENQRNPYTWPRSEEHTSELQSRP